MIIDFAGGSYFVDNYLYKLWDRFSLANVFKRNTDRVYIVDGREGVGKTTWAIQQACCLDKSMEDKEVFLSRICFTPDEFEYACKNVKNGVIIFDEAFRGFSSKSSLSKISKRLVTILMEMRQNNNIVFLVTPAFFLLELYPAMMRSDALFNIYIDKKSQKRAWRIFNRKDKNLIYQKGIKRGWSYCVKAKMRGRFHDNREHTKFPGGMEFYKAYDKKKQKSLQDLHKEGEKPLGKMEERWKEQRDMFVYNLYIQNKDKISFEKLSKQLKKQNIILSTESIRLIYEKAEKDKEKQLKTTTPQQL